MQITWSVLSWKLEIIFVFVWQLIFFLKLNLFFLNLLESNLICLILTKQSPFINQAKLLRDFTWYNMFYMIACLAFYMMQYYRHAILNQIFLIVYVFCFQDCFQKKIKHVFNKKTITAINTYSSNYQIGNSFSRIIYSINVFSSRQLDI